MTRLPIEQFARLYGGPPTHVVRAPGRVNLIGEHIDYHGLPVLPMAVDREVRLLFRARDDGTVRAATLAADHPPASFELGSRIPPAEPGDWSNYVRGPAQSLGAAGDATLGLDFLAQATLPLAAGLGSSSALAVAAGLAIAAVNGMDVDRRHLAERMAEAEQFAGTRGGGMDQAACLLGEAGHALHMRFAPLRVRPIRLDPDLRVIVAHSLVRARKAGAARSAYNERRRIGEQSLASVVAGLGLDPRTRFGDLVVEGDIVPRAARVISGTSLAYFRHVVTEGRRVARAVRALEDADLPALGSLVDESHESLRSDFRVSTPELDELVAIARQAGALGARLTGAGFGGSVVALARADGASDVCSALEREFYWPREIAAPEVRRHLMTVTASRGATVDPVTPDPPG